MSRSNIKEDIAARLNEIASAKLDLYKKAIAINATVDLSEARRMSAAEKLGRAFDLEQQRSALSRQRGIELLKTPESIRAAHDALHSKSATEEESEVDQLDEASRNPNVMRQGRTKVVKARVRGGKVQRRKRLSDVKGYTIRGGKLKRMTAQERLRRKRGQRVGKIKRKAKQARALMRRKRSLRRRASLGLKE